nr:ABC transporter ATP-binding protein [Azoarcus indigens]
MSATAAPLLKLERAVVRYGALQALGGIDLEVRAGEIVTLIGANGAGKSSTLKAISGLCKLSAGAITFDGKPLHGLAAERRIAAGIALAPEGRQLFPMLTVRDNLMIGRFSHIRAAGFGNLFRPGAAAAREVEAAMREVLDFFPRLAERIDQQAGTLSGGEGQMVAIGRALMSRPKLLMLDEPSFGLAPRVTREILELLPRLAERGIAVLLVEQNAHAALQVADRGYVLANGAIVAHGSGEELLQSSHVGEAYLGWQHEDEGTEVAA